MSQNEIIYHSSLPFTSKSTLSKFNLNGKKLVFAIVKNVITAAYIIVYGSKTKATGAMSQMHEALCQSLGCTIEYRPETTWRKVVNGTWIGIIGSVNILIVCGNTGKDQTLFSF